MLLLLQFLVAVVCATDILLHTAEINLTAFTVLVHVTICIDYLMDGGYCTGTRARHRT